MARDADERTLRRGGLALWLDRPFNRPHQKGGNEVHHVLKKRGNPRESSGQAVMAARAASIAM